MTRSHRTLMFAVISVLGLTGWKSQAAEGPGEVDDQAVAKPADAKAPKLVLLNDGRILSGVVSESEDDGMIVVTQPVGVMKFPERKIVRAFDSIQEIHQYKCDQVPEGDMDEQLKLAQWCMSKDLVAEAQGHLKNILARSQARSGPGDGGFDPDDRDPDGSEPSPRRGGPANQRRGR